MIVEGVVTGACAAWVIDGVAPADVETAEVAVVAIVGDETDGVAAVAGTAAFGVAPPYRGAATTGSEKPMMFALGDTATCCC